jgi:DNA-directed RNA polymerase specialized sigma24 family protein
MGYATTILKRQVCMGIADAVRSRACVAAIEEGAWAIDPHPDPEHLAIDSQKKHLMMMVLDELSPRDREVLTRFYLHNQEPAEILRQMDLTETRFRLLKSRAKARFHRLVQQHIQMEGRSSSIEKAVEA